MVQFFSQVEAHFFAHPKKAQEIRIHKMSQQ
jgi:hypothetical protein